MPRQFTIGMHDVIISSVKGPFKDIVDVLPYSGEMPPLVRHRLRTLGVSETGIDQLRNGQQATNPTDQQILAKVAVAAISH